MTSVYAGLRAGSNPFIGNPDLVRRMRDGIALTRPNRDLFYQGGAEGYTDYLPAS